MTADAHEILNIEPHVLRIRNVGRRFGDKTVWIRGIDIPRGNIVAVIGPSGSGKSTLLHIVGGLLRPDFQQKSQLTGVPAHRPTIDAIFSSDDAPVLYDLCKSVPREFQERIGFVFQSPYLIQAATASANVALGAFSARRLVGARSMRQIAENLAIDLQFLGDRSYVRSGGERQRIALARAFARDPNLILADEPTANLDPKLAEEIIGRLRDWSNYRTDHSTVWVTHDVRLAAEFSHSVVVLNRGRLAEWTSWPQENPRDPAILRKWIDGEVTSGFSISAPAKSRLENGQINADTKLPMPKSFVAPPATIWQRMQFWMKIGIAQVFDGSEADKIGLLRKWTSVALPEELTVRPPTESGNKCRSCIASLLWKSFGAKMLALRLASFVTVMVLLWAEFDGLSQSIHDSLITPTLNPVVMSSRATIDDRAVGEARQLLAIQRGSSVELPEAFGRYEFDHRRVSLLRGNSLTGLARERCSDPQNRADREVLMDIAALDPAEPLLRRVSKEIRPDVPTNGDVLSDRSDGRWSIWLSSEANRQLIQVLRAPSVPRVICLDVRGFWLTAEVAGIIKESIRGRFGPYEVIMSGTQWRDFGDAPDRDYYQSAAMYFDADPERSRDLVTAIRERASKISDPPNTRLIQSLADEAGFERISAALERNLFSKIIISFLGSASLFVMVLFIYSFISDYFQSNLKSICVALTLGASFLEISIIQITRLAIVTVPTVILSGLAVLGFAEYQWSRSRDLAAGSIWLLPSLSERFGTAIGIFVVGVLALTVVISGWWLMYIKQRSLTDQLKEID